MSQPFQIFSQSDYYIQIGDINSHTEWQTVLIQISWLLRSQLIWICTVFKGKVYRGSAGQGLRQLPPHCWSRCLVMMVCTRCCSWRNILSCCCCCDISISCCCCCQCRNSLNRCSRRACSIACCCSSRSNPASKKKKKKIIKKVNSTRKTTQN